jgi:crotonobetainyl-CoA:carnitine CoA-transferase CaiB-like acyl-CoA transferase
VPKDIRVATAPAGQDTDAVLSEVGYTPKDLEQLRAKGII